MAYKRPIRPAFVIAQDKVAKFSEEKPDPEEVKKRKELAEIFWKNNNQKDDNQ